MRPSTDKADELDLDLPALDGDEEAHDVDDAAFGALEVDEDIVDALDDVTGEDGPQDDIAVEGAEGGWLVDAETAGALDVGPLDAGFHAEGKVLEDDEADGRGALDDLIAGDETYVADSGEEGPLAEDEELREEDLPALDADDDGDVADDDLYDRSLLAADDDLRWDDRAWTRVLDLPRDVTAALGRDADDSGVLAIPGDDPAHTARDATWRKLDESGAAMAATFMPGGSVVLALRSADRSKAFLVRILADGEARIIAEVDPRTDDDADACTVHFARWDATRGCLFVGGSFGVEAYRPTAS